MRDLRGWTAGVLLCLGVAAGPAGAATVSGSVFYSSETVGAFGSWSIQFNSSNPDTLLQKVTIDLSPTGLYFDSAAGPPGYLLWANFAPTGGTDTATGLMSVNPGTGGILDGGTWLELAFSSFTPANGPFTFVLDVDGVANYAGCPGGLAGIGCRLARNLEASLVTSEEIAGALVTLDFWTPLVGTSTVVTTLGTLGSHTVQGDFATPEPGTVALLGVGLAALGWAGRRRRHSGR